VSDDGSLSSNFDHGMEGNLRSVLYRYAPHNDVTANDGPHIRRWSYKIIILQYDCVTLAYSIQYSNMLYRFVAWEQWAVYRLGVR
jgi:hypothetical protein